MRLTRLVSALALVLVVALVMPATSAQAATLPSPTVYAISPNVTPYTPESVRQPPVREPGAVGKVSNYLDGLLWAGKGAVQSVGSAAWDMIQALSGKRTNTGYGFSGATLCSADFNDGGGTAGLAWSVNGVQVDRLPITRVTIPHDPQVSVAICDRDQVVNSSQVCLAPSGAIVRATPVPTASTLAGQRNSCKSEGIGEILSVTIDPSDTNQRYGGTEGGHWINPDQSAQIAARTVVTVTKVCRPIPPATGADTTVSAAGAQGSGTVPNVACPAGRYVVSQSVSSALPDGSFKKPLTSSAISNTAASSYPNCMAGTCALAVEIDGTKCSLIGAGCLEWWKNKAGDLAGKVACKWGSYSMPIDDCAPLQNCYQYPLASIQGSTDGASACGIAPDGPADAAPMPITDGKIRSPIGTLDPTPTAPFPTGPAPSGSVDPTAPAPGGNGTVIVNVPQPTVIVNVPAPTVNVSVTVNVPQPTVIVNVPGQGTMRNIDPAPRYPGLWSRLLTNLTGRIANPAPVCDASPATHLGDQQDPARSASPPPIWLTAEGEQITMLLIGTVLKVEHIKGENARGPYDFHQVHILETGSTPAIHLATPGRDFGPPPGEGEDLVAYVSVTPNKNNRSGAAELRINLDSRANLDDLLDATTDSAAHAA